MVELVNTNNLGLFDREIVQVQVLFPLVDLFYINPASFIPLNSRFIPSRPPAPLSLLLERGAGYASVPFLKGKGCIPPTFFIKKRVGGTLAGEVLVWKRSLILFQTNIVKKFLLSERRLERP